MVSSASMWEQITGLFRWAVTLSPESAFTHRMLKIMLSRSLGTIFNCVLPIFLTVLVVGVFAHITQFGFIFTPEGLTPNFERINPLSGIKRLVSLRGLYEIFKSCLKFSLVIGISFLLLKKELLLFNGYLQGDFAATLMFSRHFVVKLFAFLLVGASVVAVIDFTWEKLQFRKKLLQSKQQLKQETKEREGNPEIRQRIRSIQRELIRKRMMNDVPKADVIITNPTHFSVALRYDKESMTAPTVIAKGKDHLALKIREIAKNHQIPLVENRPLAQNLYRTVKVGESIPHHLYKAVAEVLAYVMKLKKRLKM